MLPELRRPSGVEWQAASIDTPIGVSFPSLFSVLRRHILIVLCVVLAITAAAVAIMSQITPIYVATATIEVQRAPNPGALSGSNLIANVAQFDPAVIGTATQILRSPNIAREVIESLRLDKLPEFTAPNRLRLLISEAEHWAGLDPLPPFDAKAAANAIALRNLMSRVAVFSTQDSYVVAISAESTSAVLSAKIANAFASAYLDFQRRQKAAAIREANSLLDDHLQQLKKEAIRAENAAEEFREKNGLAVPANTGGMGTGLTVVGQQLAELNSQLIAATNLRVWKEADLRQIQALINTGHLEGAPQVLGSRVIERLSEQESAAAARLAVLESKYGANSAVLIAPRAELSQVHQRIAEEMFRLARGVASEVAATRERETALRTNLAHLQARVNGEGSASVRLNELKTEAAANLSVYQDVLTQEKRTANEAEMQRPDAALISVAQPPLDPSFPRRGLTLLGAIAGSSVLGIFLALTLERRHENFQSAEEFEAVTSLPTLGLLPNGGYPWRRGAKSNGQNSPVQEAVAGISFRLWHRAPSPSGRVVMVTSSVPKEGKTYVAISLAQSLAQNGAHVLLIDCDLRKAGIASEMGLSGPGLNKLFTAPTGPSTSRELAHSGVLGDDIATQVADGLDVVPVFPGLREPLRLLSSLSMELLINHARVNYDIVILDTPPILAVADAGVVARLADVTILVTRWRKTPRLVVASAIQLLKDYGADIAGAVLNRVNAKQYASGRFGSYAYVYRNCQAYYSQPRKLRSLFARADKGRTI